MKRCNFHLVFSFSCFVLSDMTDLPNVSPCTYIRYFSYPWWCFQSLLSLYPNKASGSDNIHTYVHRPYRILKIYAAFLTGSFQHLFSLSLTIISDKWKVQTVIPVLNLASLMLKIIIFSQLFNYVSG